MSEKSVILLQDISSSQADTESVVGAAVFLSPFDALEEKVAGERERERQREERRVKWEVQRDQLKTAVCERRGLVGRQNWRTRKAMLLVALTRLESLCTSLKVSRAQKSFVERDFQKRL